MCGDVLHMKLMRTFAIEIEKNNLCNVVENIKDYIGKKISLSSNVHYSVPSCPFYMVPTVPESSGFCEFDSIR